jgi:hypothetical protein
MRVTARAALSVAAIGVTIGAAMTPASPAVAAPTTTSAPTIIVTPHAGVKNNATVSVSGANFPANLTIYVVECSALTGAAGCDLTTLDSSTATSSTGTFSNVKVMVHTGKVGSGSCIPGGTCHIVVSINNTLTGIGTVSAVFTFARPTHPTLTVNPRNGAVSGGHVHISGRGFPAGRRIDLAECTAVNTTFSCDVRTFRTSRTTNANGVFRNVSMQVFTGGVTKKSCANGGKCYLIVGTVAKNPGIKNTAEAMFTFATKKATKITVTVRAHHLVGKVRAAGSGIAGLKAVVQREVGRRWKKVATFTTRRHGVFSSPRISRRGTYRILVPRQLHRGTIYLASTSRKLTITG